MNKNKVIRQPAYYIIAHASKFVRPGSIRISSTSTEGLYSVAYLTPNNKIVLIVLNENKQITNFSVKYKDKSFIAKLDIGSAATFVW